jgi:hypothetical protein
MVKLNQCHRVGFFRPSAEMEPGVFLSHRLARDVESRANLLEQFCPRIRFWNKSTQTLREHVAELALLGETAAQDYSDVGIEAPQFVEYRVSVHHGKKKVEDNETYLLAHFLINP